MTEKTGDTARPLLPRHKLATSLKDESKTPLVILACGSFSPITYLHLRIFEMAKDYVRDGTEYEIIGGYLSPVSDAYKKRGLESSEHRVKMCELAVQSSDWLMVDAWESSHDTFQRTAVVLDHMNAELNGADGLRGISLNDGSRKRVHIKLLAGGDLIESFKVPNLWAEADLHHILGDYGCFVIERTGSDIHGFLLDHDVLYSHRRNVHVIRQLLSNDVSSTKIRLFRRRGISIKYLIPDSVVDYIENESLYLTEKNSDS